MANAVGAPLSPLRLMLEGASRGLAYRNMALDGLVHDLGALTSGETRALTTGTPASGSLLLVPPAGGGEIAVHADAMALAVAEGRRTAEIAIAGAGASALGAAALARTVANVTGRAAIGIVPSCGPDDAAVEAIGGALFWGPFGRARHLVQDLRHRVLSAAMAQMQPGLTGSLPPEAGTGPVATSLIKLMRQRDRRIGLIVAHGAGAAELSHALSRLSVSSNRAAFERAAHAQIVTAGMAVPFPDGVNWVTRLMGQLDGIGEMNSPASLPRQVVPMAGHHLNTALPLHLDLGRHLVKILGLDRATGG